MNFELEEMDVAQITKPVFGPRTAPAVSQMARELVGSEILKISADVRGMIAEGHAICNLTVGHFNLKYFPIPNSFRKSIELALQAGETN